jgi:hypothetical protein
MRDVVMKKYSILLIFSLLLIIISPDVKAGEVTNHLLSLHGMANDSTGAPLSSGDVAVRIYDALEGGSLIYNSGTDFNGSINDGIFDIVLGSGAVSLQLDNTLLYYLEIDINGEEIIGDASGGRQSFYPGGGDHSRLDLESRLDTVEDLVFFECDPDYYDLNGNPADQCEFYLDPNVIYVSAETGTDDEGCGTGPVAVGGGCYPCSTIAYGIGRASFAGRSEIHVTDGTYNESFTLADGISLKGGYTPSTWERHLSSTSTIIRGATLSGHKKTINALNITSATVLEGFIIYGESSFDNSGNSYAVYVDNSGTLEIRYNYIFAGNGGPGADGIDGPSGDHGPDGAPGLGAKNTSHDCYEQCSSSSENPGGAGGTRFCGEVDISGGDGGRAYCPDYDESSNDLCSSCPTVPYDQTTRYGEDAPGGGGSGGLSGYDNLISFDCTGDCACYAAPNGWPTYGADGLDGSNGSDGSGGSGASSGNGSVSGNEWIGQIGEGGTDGTYGLGGGGGGAGGGVENYNNFNCGPSSDASDIGGSGGGGGAGGCGGTAGTGGDYGGGSFGIFVVNGTIPTIEYNYIMLGIGGPGGRGGHGGAGGLGGDGAGGGAGGSSDYWCAGAGGKGGDGGDGGHGGGGGGGAGGIAAGIYTYGASGDPCASSNTYVGGAGGSGGSSGSSVGSSGSAGSTGNVINCVTN